MTLSGYCSSSALTASVHVSKRRRFLNETSSTIERETGYGFILPHSTRSGLAVWNFMVTARSVSRTVASWTSRAVCSHFSSRLPETLKKKKKRKMVCACLVTVLLVLYILFDVNYFLRILFTLGLGRLLQKRKKIFDTTVIYGNDHLKFLLTVLSSSPTFNSYIMLYGLR